MRGALLREARELAAQARLLAGGERDALADLQADPSRILTRAGYTPDPWQTTLLRSSSDRVLMLASRQVGKSLCAAALALREALLRPRSLVLMLAPSLRQSQELYKDKLRPLYRALGRPVPVVRETELQMELANGSRVISLPGTDATVRGYSGVRLLVVDEASRVPDSLFFACLPMLAVSGGRLVVLSTPWAKMGFFYQEWHHGEGWRRVEVPAADCPRIAPAFLEEQRRKLGPRWFAMEFECAFGEMTDAVFLEADIAAACADDVPPLFGGGARW